MATKAAMKKLAVTNEAGKLQRPATVLALLQAHGPMIDRDISANMLRIDPALSEPYEAPSKEKVRDPSVNRLQVVLYNLRRKELVEKQDDGSWAAS